MPGTSSDDAAALQAEVERLQALVGPSEESYQDLRVELLAARDAARGAAAEAGNLRGELTETRVMLSRAQQDQQHFQEIVYDTLRAARRRLSRVLRARL